jgi:eukaryotic-like serine/threonine-protein kinase
VELESPAEGHQVYEFSSFTLDPSTRMLLRGTLPIPLPPKVFDTLLYMVQNPDRVLGKDEMMAAIWPDRVLEEGNLSQNIFTLRKALKDGDKVRSIVTAPGRGYRFTASIRRISRRTTQPQSVAEVATRPGPTLPDAPAPSAARAVGVSSNPAFRNVALTVGSLLLVVGGLVYSVGHGPTTERSRILLTGIANLTDDAAFNTVPGNVLEISLSQSPFLSLIPSQQVGKTLQLMERPADTKLSAELAQEVCLRNQGKAMLSGAIAAFGSHYVVTFEASDCASGERIVQSKVEANRKEDVPRAIDRLISSMRTRLGESLSSVRQFGIPIEQATTASFEGLKAFSAGEQSRYQGDNAAAVPLFKRAVELDPSFALAYAELAGAYVGLREPETARIYYQMAFEHRDRASEMERLWISAEYLKLIGDLSESINSYRALASLYPTDGRPWESLADLYTRLARYQDAVEAARVGLRLNPEDSRAYIVLARAYKRSNRFDEANAIGDQATAKGLDGWPMHCLLYEVAFALGDVGKMSEQIMKETGKPGEGWIVEYEALGAATAGKLKQSRAMFERSIALTEAGGGEDRRATVSNFYVDYISMLAQFGLYQEARRLVSRTRGVEENDEGPYALAQIGELERAAELDREFGRRFPDSTLLNGFTRPRTQAAIALGQRRPRDALAALQPALAAKLRTFDVPLLLGRAHLDLKEPVEAATDFQEILENRGVDGVSPAYPLAYLGLARAMRMHGNVQKSRAAYERLFAFWKDADPDNPVLVRARREYAALGYSASAPGL